MTSTNKAILYINGLGNGQPNFLERTLAHQVVKRGLGFEFLNIDWYDGSSYEYWIDRGCDKLADMRSTYGSVAIWGSSAGASLGLLMFVKYDDSMTSYVNIRGRLREGDLHHNDWRSLDWAAHVDTEKQSLSFKEAVIQVAEVSGSLSNAMISRVRTYAPLFDELVPRKCVAVLGAENIIMPVIGHKPAWLYAVRQELKRL